MPESADPMTTRSSTHAVNPSGSRAARGATGRGGGHQAELGDLDRAVADGGAAGVDRVRGGEKKPCVARWT